MSARSSSISGPTAELDASGYAIIRGAASPGAVRRIAEDLGPAIERTPFSVGPFYGSRTKRFGRLPSRSAATIDLIVDPVLLDVARTVIGRHHPDVGLNLTQLISVHPDAPAQVPHRDDEMWPIPSPVGEHLVNVIWPLTLFRRENGATLVWPGSHRGTDAASGPIVAEMEPGDALVVLGSTLHAQGANTSREVRTGIVVGYRAAWLLPGENPWLGHPPTEAVDWPTEFTDLLGYRRLAPNLNGVDCRCPSELLRGDAAGTGAVDTLRPAQIEGLRRFRSQAGTAPTTTSAH